MNPGAAGTVFFLDDVVDALSGALASLASAGALPPAFAHAFMARALLAVLIVTPLFGALGVLVTARRLAFFSTALGQAAMAGVALGVALGEPIDAPWAGLFGTTTLCAVWLVVLRRRGRLPADTLTGVFLALSLAVGVAALVVVTRRFNVHQLEGVLLGSPLTVRSTDLALIALVAVVVAVVAARTASTLLLDALDPGVAAASAGRDALRSELAFVVVLAAAVVVASRVVGALLVEALVVLPAATARATGAGLRKNVVVAVVAALASGVVGLVVSAATPVPAGAAIVLSGGALFGLALLAGARAR